MQFVLPFVLATVVTMGCLPFFVRLGNRLLFIDQPDARKVHTAPIPRVGGLAMACGILVAAWLTVPMGPTDRWFLVAAAVLVAFGALDDRLNLDYRIKLFGQILAVGIVIFAGEVRIHELTLAGRVPVPAWIGLPLTFVFLIGVTNAINLADGLDGLAGGMSFLCLCAIALMASASSQGVLVPLVLVFAGAVLGFLRFNSYPASVFMGDAGSQLLGFTIGTLSLRLTQNPAAQLGTAIPVMLLALPILDTLSVMVQRIADGRSPFSADKSHIHHKLLAMGFNHYEAVLVIYLVQAGLFTAAYFLRFESDIVVLAVVLAFFGGSIALLQWASRSGWMLRGSRVRPSAAGMPLWLDRMYQPEFLPQLSYWILAGALFTYAGVVLVDTATLSADIRLLIVSLLVLVIALSVVLRRRPLSGVEKAVLYITSAMLVYLDEVDAHVPLLSAWLTWSAIGVAALATAFRLRFYSDRRFQLTPLDLIVLFMALVVPRLPGITELPSGTALGIAKLLVLFYAVEMLVSRSDGRTVWLRVSTAFVLTGFACRALIPGV